MEDFTDPDEVWEFPMPDILEDYRWEPIYKQVEECKKRGFSPVFNAIQIFEPAWYLRGLDNLLCDMMTDEDMAEACLKLAKEAQEEKIRIRAIRSYIRVPRQFELPLETKIAMCRTAFDTAARPAEKALIFEVFKRSIDVRSAQAALSYADDEAFRELACDTIVAIATKFKGQSEDMKAVLRKVLELTQKPENVAAAKEIMARL